MVSLMLAGQLSNVYSTHESTPPSLHIVLREWHRRRPNTSIRKDNIRSSSERLADLREQVISVNFFRDIRLYSQELGRTGVQSLKRSNSLVEFLLASATDHDTFGACADPDAGDCLMRGQKVEEKDIF
jgi:hypothetical protein